MCQAISEIDTSRKLNGLMVAGYMEGVYVIQDPKSDRIFKTTQGFNTQRRVSETEEKYEERRQQALNRPMHPVEGASKFYNKLKSYMKRKRVFVWKDGAWSPGNLSEFTDKDQSWKKKLSAIS